MTLVRRASADLGELNVSEDATNRLEPMADIIVAYVSNNSVAMADLPGALPPTCTGL
jgi:predicted transcriptional regulator